jgi:hypothetical protein
MHGWYRPRRTPPNVRTRDIQRLCDDVATLATSLRDEIDVLSELAYTRLPGPANVKVRTGPMDATADQAIHAGAVKSAVAAVIDGIQHAHRSLVRAERMRLKALDVADEREDFRDPQGRYTRAMEEPMISKRELLEAKAYAAKRNGHRL